MPTITLCGCGRRMIPNPGTGNGLMCVHCDRPCVRVDAEQFCPSCSALGIKRPA
jgi:rubrerythrin